MRYLLIAGEASGDLHASHLIRALKARDPEADIRFLGGDLMAAEAGRNPEIHYTRMNVMGFSEVLRHLPAIASNMRRARRILAEFRPDALVLVDYPGFNLAMAKYARRLGVPVHYFISPKVWAWKEYRVKAIRRCVARMYCILPFEVGFYRKRGYEADYVGNPSVGEIAAALAAVPSRANFLERHGLPADKPLIALLPGSRRGEIRNNLPVMVEAAKRFPEFRYVVAAAPSVGEKFYRETAQDPGLDLVFGSTAGLLRHSEAAVVTSGTATLETALCGTPQVVVYRANGMKLSYKVMEKLLKVDYVSLPNLIAGREVVPELLVHRCTPGAVASALSPLLQPSPLRDMQLRGCREIRRRLGAADAAANAAGLIVDSLRKPICK